MSGKRLTKVERKHIKSTRRFLTRQGQPIVTAEGRVVEMMDPATMYALFKGERELQRIGK